MTISSPPVPSSDKARKQRWESGIQAIFAGFVAAAHLRGVSSIERNSWVRLMNRLQLRPTILAFWGTEQLPLVRPSLISLTPTVIEYEGNERSGQEDGILQQVLLDVLQVSSNVRSLPQAENWPDDTQKSTVCKETPNEGKDAGSPGAILEAEWELMKGGKKLFTVPAQVSSPNISPAPSTPSSSRRNM